MAIAIWLYTFEGGAASGEDWCFQQLGSNHYVFARELESIETVVLSSLAIAQRLQKEYKRR